MTLPVLDGLGVNQLLELLLLSDQKVILMGGSLGGDGVVPWTEILHTEAKRLMACTGGNILSINHRDGEVGGGGGDLAGLVECGLGRVGVEEGGNGLTWTDHGD